VLVDAGMASSGGEVRRLVGQGAVTVNGERIDDFTIDLSPGDEVKVGRHRFLRVVAEGGTDR
jgi:tyrosyl-tRNA synthetase